MLNSIEQADTIWKKDLIKPGKPKHDRQLPLLSEEQKTQIDAAVNRVGDELANIMQENGYSSSELSDILQPYLTGVAAVSRLVNHAEKRYPSAGLLFAMHRVFGIDLNALADGGDTTPDFPPALRQALLDWAASQSGKKP